MATPVKSGSVFVDPKVLQSKIYKPTNYRQQFLDKFLQTELGESLKGSNLQEFFRSLEQEPEKNQGMGAFADALKEYQAATKKDKDALQDKGLYIDPVTGKSHIWNSKGGGWVEQSEIDPNTAPTYETLFEEAKKTDPNNLPYNNPEANKPILPTDYTGQISLPTPKEEMDLMAYLKKQFEDKTYENKYTDLQKQYQEIANRPDKYSGMIEKAGGENQAEYIRSLYEGAADPLRREAQRMQEKNQADLAARGLGMSTVVNDVNNPVQRELMAVLGDLSNQATVQGRQDYINALKSAADVYGQSNAQQGNILNAMQTNIGNQLGAQQLGLGNIQKILADQEARRLTNMQTGINQWDKTVNNYWKYHDTPQNAYSGQNATANTAAGVGGQIYGQQQQNAAAQNQLVGNFGATLANNLFKQPQNSSWVPVGGLSGAQQGGSAGFSTKPKTGAFNQ